MHHIGIFFLLYLASAQIPEDPLSEYIHVPTRFIAPLPANSILKDNTSPEKMSVNLCAAKCTLLFRSGNFPCYAFEYTPGSNMCIYTNITTLMLNAGYLSLKQNNAVDYYERPKGSFKNLFQKQPNTALQDGGSYYTIKKNMTADQCAHLCVLSSHPPCLSFSYSKQMDTCGLSNKYHSNHARSDTPLISTPLYDHFQYFTAWACNAIIPANYTPKALGSVRFPYQAVRNVDCFIKLEAPPGHKIKISFPTLFFGRRICQNMDEGIILYDGVSETAPVLDRFCETGRQGDLNLRKSTSNSVYLKYKTNDVPMAFKAAYQFEGPCDENNCQNGGSCLSTNSSYVCKCPSGWSGRFCEANIDDCLDDPCLFGGKCIDQIDGYVCLCPKGFTGSRCDLFLGACTDKPCIHGKCHVTSPSNYTCTCEEGYIGTNCEKKQEFCRANPCLHGECIETFGYYMCNCRYGFTGRNCEYPVNLCLSHPCAEGVCSSSNGTYTCTCSPSFTGKNCDVKINFCEGINCFHGKCMNMNNTYKCECKDGFTGNNCETDIGLDNPCDHAMCGSGLCETLHRNRMGYRCICPNGYGGQHCETRVLQNTGKEISRDLCDLLPCENGGKCRLNHDGTPTCICRAPFVGDVCQTRLGDCDFNPCPADATCVENPNGHTCLCSPGYEGPTCAKKATPCSPNPCISGRCVEENTATGYRCIRYNIVGFSNITITPVIRLYNGSLSKKTSINE